jgi:citrate synthase
MGDLDKKPIGNLGDPRLLYDYMNREHGTMPADTTRAPFRWVSEIAYKNIHRIVARGYDTTEFVEQGYGLVDMLFVDFQARIPLVEEEQMLNYVMILALEDGLSMPTVISRMVGRSKTFLTQACGASILAFGHAYGAFSAFGNMLIEGLARAEEEDKTLEEVARDLVREKPDDPALGVSDLMLKDPAA